MSKRSIDSDTPEGQSMMKILLQHLWAISHVILQQPFNLLSTPLIIPNIGYMPVAVKVFGGNNDIQQSFQKIWCRM
jgi:hypothetical protein